jgi:hypothetical protein
MRLYFEDENKCISPPTSLYFNHFPQMADLSTMDVRRLLLKVQEALRHTTERMSVEDLRLVSIRVGPSKSCTSHRNISNSTRRYINPAVWSSFFVEKRRLYSDVVTYPLFVVTKCGTLFEAFLVTDAGPKFSRKWSRTSKATARGQPFPEEYQDDVWERLKMKWSGWLIRHLASLGRPGKEQLQTVTSMARFLGLSRLGQDVLARHGAVATIRYTDKRLNDADDRYKAELR